MDKLTEEEREAIFDYLLSCESAFLVENLMSLMPEQDLKELGSRLVADLEEFENHQIEVEAVSPETLDGIYTNAMHLAHHLRIAGVNDVANGIEELGIRHGKRKENTNG